MCPAKASGYSNSLFARADQWDANGIVRWDFQDISLKEADLDNRGTIIAFLLFLPRI